MPLCTYLVWLPSIQGGLRCLGSWNHQPCMNYMCFYIRRSQALLPAWHEWAVYEEVVVEESHGLTRPDSHLQEGRGDAVLTAAPMLHWVWAFAQCLFLSSILFLRPIHIDMVHFHCCVISRSMRGTWEMSSFSCGWGFGQVGALRTVLLEHSWAFLLYTSASFFWSVAFNFQNFIPVKKCNFPHNPQHISFHMQA